LRVNKLLLFIEIHTSIQHKHIKLVQSDKTRVKTFVMLQKYMNNMYEYELIYV